MYQYSKQLSVFAFIFSNIIEYYDTAVVAYSLGMFIDYFLHESITQEPMQFLSMVIALSSMLGLIFSFISAYIIDNYGSKIAIRLSSFSLGLPTLCLGFLPSVDSLGIYSSYIFIVALSLSFFVKGSCHKSVALYIQQALGKGKPHTANGILWVSSCLGAYVGILLCQYCIDDGNSASITWRIPLIIGGTTTILLSYIQRYAYDTLSDVNKVSISVYIKKMRSNIWRNLQLIFLGLVVYGSVGACYALYIKIDPIYMSEIASFASYEDTALMISYRTAFFILFAPLAGFIADYTSAFTVIILGTIGSIISLLLHIYTIEFIYTFPIFLQIITSLSFAMLYIPIYRILFISFDSKDRILAITIISTLGTALITGSALYVVTKMYHYTSLDSSLMIYSLCLTLIIAMIMIPLSFNKRKWQEP